MKRIFQNWKLLKEKFVKLSSVLFACISAILLFFEKDTFGIDSTCAAILALLCPLVFSAVASLIATACHRENVVFSQGGKKIIIKYGDLWKYAFPKRLGRQRVVVIGVNTSFDTIVDDPASSIKAPLVSLNTLHGQWVKKLEGRQITHEELDRAIRKSLNMQKAVPLHTLDSQEKSRGNLECYPVGTVGVFQHENTIFYLIALSEFDHNNNAHATKTDVARAVVAALDYYDKNGQGYDIYFPLLGSGMSRSEITPKESLEIITACLKIYKEKIHGTATVVVHIKQRENVSIEI